MHYSFSAEMIMRVTTAEKHISKISTNNKGYFLKALLTWYKVWFILSQ